MAKGERRGLMSKGLSRAPGPEEFERPAPSSMPAAERTPEPTPEHAAAPGKRWPIPPIMAIAIVAALFIVSQIAAAIVVSIALGVSGQENLMKGVADGTASGASSVIMQFVFIALSELLLIGGLIWVLRRYKVTLAAIGWKKPKLSDSGKVIAAFIGYFALYIVLATVLQALVPGLDVEQKQDIGFNGATGFVPLLLVGIALIGLAPLAEELLMRGFLFTTLRKRGAGFAVATIVTSAVFAFAHLFGGEQGASLLWIAAIDTFVLSLVLCYLRERTGHIWAGVGVHALKNSVAFVMLFIVQIR